MQVHNFFALTDDMRKKLIKGKTVQLKSIQIGGGHDSLYLDGDNFKRVVKAHRLNKGVRLALNEAERHHNANADDKFKKILTKVEHVKYGTGFIQQARKDWKALAKSANKTFSKKNMVEAGKVAKKVGIAIAPAVSGLLASAAATATGNPALAKPAGEIVSKGVAAGLSGIKGSGKKPIAATPIVTANVRAKRVAGKVVVEAEPKFINLVGGSFVSSGY